MDPNVKNIEQNEQLDAQNLSQDNDVIPTYQQYCELFDSHICEDEWDECSGDIILFV
jgi:hypothetical protein